MAWNSWQVFYSLSVDAARRIGDKTLESTHVSYLAWAELVEQGDAHAASERAQQAVLAARETGDNLALGWATFYKGSALNALKEYEAAAVTLTESAAAFDRIAHVTDATQARIVARKALEALAIAAGRDGTA